MVFEAQPSRRKLNVASNVPMYLASGGRREMPMFSRFSLFKPALSLRTGICVTRGRRGRPAHSRERRARTRPAWTRTLGSFSHEFMASRAQLDDGLAQPDRIGHNRFDVEDASSHCKLLLLWWGGLDARDVVAFMSA